MLSATADAEILAMMNYETKSPESLKALKNAIAPQARREGIAIIDVDPQSDNFGNILVDIPLPADLVAHHLFYNRDMSKIYLTALGQPAMHVIDVSQNPYRLKRLDTPGCTVQEDIIFSADNKTWWVTCMGSNTVVEGNAETDEIVRNISTPEKYPHGIAVSDGIDRLLISSTVNAADLGDPGETITAIEASTGKPLKSYKVSSKPSPAGEAPVEILFVPGANPPVAYVTNMYGGSLWTASWDADKGDFVVAQAHDFGPQEAGVPLEIYFNDDSSRLYVTTANPGHFHVFDISGDPAKPKLTKTLPTAQGAHHVAFTKDWKLAFVQNTLLNLPGMSDGSVTVIDLEKEEVIGSVDTLKEMGFNPNSIILLPEWNHLAGH
ncbi:MAG: YncE family protein [Alphaproteobacteria bacterium]|nr:YncE family protein [Alphaproteobacteria bacterium]